MKPLDIFLEISGHLQQNMIFSYPIFCFLCLNTTSPESQCRHGIKVKNRTPTKGLTHKEIQHICGLHTCILAFELDQFKTRRLCEEREVSPSACFPLLIGCFRKCPFSESQLVSLLLLHLFLCTKACTFDFSSN